MPAIAANEEQILIGPGEVHVRKAGEVLHPQRMSQEDLDRNKIEMGSFNFSAQYQQQPIPVEGEIVKWEWFQFYDQLPPRRGGDIIVQSWDTATKPMS